LHEDGEQAKARFKRTLEFAPPAAKLMVRGAGFDADQARRSFWKAASTYSETGFANASADLRMDEPVSAAIPRATMASD